MPLKYHETGVAANRSRRRKQATRLLLDGNAYLAEARALEFDVIEISTGFISLAQDDLLRLIEKVRNLGLKPKP